MTNVHPDLIVSFEDVILEQRDIYAHRAHIIINVLASGYLDALQVAIDTACHRYYSTRVEHVRMREACRWVPYSVTIADEPVSLTPRRYRAILIYRRIPAHGHTPTLTVRPSRPDPPSTEDPRA